MAKQSINPGDRRAEMKRQLERKRIAEVNKAPFVTGVADAPFGHCGRLYSHQMRDFIIAMIPIILTATFAWRTQVLAPLVAAAATAVACEVAMSFILKQPLRISNLHSVVIGLTLALLMPMGTPW